MLPDDKIGFIWDAASSDLSEDVIDYAEELGITIGFISGELTSILQICDLILKKPLKQLFRQFYTEFKILTDPDLEESTAY